jgi:hypothetical protein
MIRAMQPFEQPAPRLAVVLHYLIARTAGRDFGGVKINKAVCAADADFYRRYGRTITGAESFQKQKFGPVPNGVVKALKRLRQEGKIVQFKVDTPAGTRDEFSAQVEPDLKQFDSAEIDVLNVAIASLAPLSATAASEQTHDALWDEVAMLGQIPIKAAAFRPVQVDQDILAWALSEEA